MCGNLSLFRKYYQEIEVILNRKSTQSNEPIYKERILNLLKGHVVEFEPRIESEEAHKFNVKFALFRLLSFSICGIAEYFGIRNKRTLRIIDELEKMKIINEKGAKNLKWALSMAMGLRICIQIFYGRECEDVYYQSNQVRKLEQPSWGSEEDFSEMGFAATALTLFNTELYYYKNVYDSCAWLKEFNERIIFVPRTSCLEKIARAYSIIIPFHQAVRKACQTGNFEALAKETFENTSLRELGKSFDKLNHIEQAKYCYLREYLTNPKDFENLLDLIRIFRKLGHDRYAEEYAIKALTEATDHEKKVLDTIIEEIHKERNPSK